MQHHNDHLQSPTEEQDQCSDGEDGRPDNQEEGSGEGEGIGAWRVSRTGCEDIKFPQSKWEMRENSEIIIQALTVNNIELTLQEEYDVDHLCNPFEDHKRVMVRAEYAGVEELLLRANAA